jgi:hypothetical protein
MTISDLAGYPRCGRSVRRTMMACPGCGLSTRGERRRVTVGVQTKLTDRARRPEVFPGDTEDPTPIRGIDEPTSGS